MEQLSVEDQLAAVAERKVYRKDYHAVRDAAFAAEVSYHSGGISRAEFEALRAAYATEMERLRPLAFKARAVTVEVVYDDVAFDEDLFAALAV